MAQRFHRTFNVGLVVAAALVLVTLVVSLIGVVTLQGRTADLRHGTLAALGRAAGARIAANDAKSNESLTLIARGSGATFEKAWQTSAAAVTTDLAGLGSADLTTQWQRYADVHTAIRKLDDGGQWDQAVSRATGGGRDSANTTFAALDSGLKNTVELNSVLTSRTLSGLQPGLVVGAVLTLLAGLAAGYAGRRGVETRLAEYR